VVIFFKNLSLMKSSRSKMNGFESNDEANRALACDFELARAAQIHIGTLVELVND
jgi:hypothetical protein